MSVFVFTYKSNKKAENSRSCNIETMNKDTNKIAKTVQFMQ
jgi:hypothetical protein